MRTVPFMACTVLFGGLALAGCSGKDGGNAAAIANDTSPAAAVARMPKAGLWQMTTSVTGMPKPITATACVAEPKPGSNPFAPPTQPGQSCAKSKIVPTASGYTIDMECAANGVTMAMQGTVSGDFTSSYKVDLNTKMTGANIPPAAQKATNSTVDAKYVGACPAGMKPGETKLVS